MVPCDDPPMSVVRQGALVIIDVEPGFGVSFGATNVGSRSSLEVRQISPVCFLFLRWWPHSLGQRLLLWRGLCAR